MTDAGLLVIDWEHVLSYTRGFQATQCIKLTKGPSAEPILDWTASSYIAFHMLLGFSLNDEFQLTLDHT